MTDMLPPAPGHNGDPPLTADDDMGALRRLQRAKALGTYHDHTSETLEPGRHG